MGTNWNSAFFDNSVDVYCKDKTKLFFVYFTGDHDSTVIKALLPRGAAQLRFTCGAWQGHGDPAETP